MATCTKCEEDKSEDCFGKRPNGSPYRICKECQKEYRRCRYWRKREELLAYNKEYREKNREILAHKRTERFKVKKFSGYDQQKLRERRKRSVTKWKEKNKHKIRAHELVRNAINNGSLVKGTECEKCGKQGRLEGHHEDYSKAYEVVWLCRHCHGKYHGSGVNGVVEFIRNSKQSKTT